MKKTIREIRKEKGMTQLFVASKLGISREQLSRMERDNNKLRNSKINTVLSLASLYDVSIDDIFFDNNYHTMV